MIPAGPAPADRGRALPAGAAARLAAADAAVGALAAEQRRLRVLALEWPLARNHEQLRYWRFVRALCALAAGERR